MQDTRTNCKSIKSSSNLNNITKIVNNNTKITNNIKKNTENKNAYNAYNECTKSNKYAEIIGDSMQRKVNDNYKNKSVAHSTKLGECAVTKESKTTRKQINPLVYVLLFFSILFFSLIFIYVPLNDRNSTINQVVALDATGSCGTNVSYTWDSSSGTLTISGTGAMTDYFSSSSRSPFYYQTAIKTITIGNGVTSIGNYAFDSCSKLMSVTIPDSVTSIGGGAFQDCSGLTSVTIGSGVTSIGVHAFSYCSGLTSVTIPNSIIAIGAAVFFSCSGLTSIIIPDSVTSIGENAFGACSNLISIVIPDTVTYIYSGEYGGAFSNCDKLTIIGSGDTTKYPYTYAKSNKINYVTAWVPSTTDATKHTRTYYGFKDDANATGTTQTELHTLENGVCSVCGALPEFTITLDVTTNVNRSFVIYILDSAGQATRQFIVTGGSKISFQVKTTDTFTVQVYETLYSVIKIDGERVLKKTYSNLTEDTTIDISISGVTNINNWIMI